VDNESLLKFLFRMMFGQAEEIEDEWIFNGLFGNNAFPISLRLVQQFGLASGKGRGTRS